jgi:hypothetical protein
VAVCEPVGDPVEVPVSDAVADTVGVAVCEAVSDADGDIVWLTESVAEGVDELEGVPVPVPVPDIDWVSAEDGVRVPLGDACCDDVCVRLCDGTCVVVCDLDRPEDSDTVCDCELLDVSEGELVVLPVAVCVCVEG